MPLTVEIHVGRRAQGTHPLPVIQRSLLRALPGDALVSVLEAVGLGRFGVRIEITNNGATVPWEVSQTVQRCVFVASKHQRRAEPEAGKKRRRR